MRDQKNTIADRVFTLDEFKEIENLNHNTNSRVPIFFCVDVSGSMANMVGYSETRLSLLQKVMTKLLEDMKAHPGLNERAVVGIVTYNNRAVIQQAGLDICNLDIYQAVNFNADNQTIFSLGLKRTLQAIDTYRDTLRRGDVDTFTPIMVFMTDGEPVGDSTSEIASVYNEIWGRINNNDLHVFPIGISADANMGYVDKLAVNGRGYQMITDRDYVTVFSQIQNILDSHSDKKHSYEENTISTEKASKKKTTKNTVVGEVIASFDDELDMIYQMNKCTE